ncbi:ABC transporter permease [Streptomyces diastatochromogenes]|uniref:ABC transporter permease n=1 Tax=Streptomyces diastatochromogenes TaxID=42236 RepID=A0A233SHK9_STRDA|nr:ABC transporter permease [Streptomyces diastatochromogenes]MCZ0985523.1 ABC transporter permease [Streptomyces diastatochromogenes]OXY95039.1 ABC transporter permease [Streptomyces diastatochromogenes]
MATFRLVVRRLLSSTPLLFLVSALTFVLVSLVPGDPARTIVGQHATVEQYETVRRQLGLDEPLPVQYWHWLVRVFHGDLGTSLFSGEPVTSVLNNRLPVSLSLITAGTIVSGVLGVLLGLLSARRGGLLVKAVDVLALVGLAVPAFWFALVLIAVGAVRLRWFPVTGYVPLADDPVEWGRSLVLPVLSLSLSAVAIIAKQTRDSVLDTFGRDFIRVMQANGFSRRSILYRHVLRNAALPLVTVLGVVLVSLLAAAVFVETVFAMPGLGSLTQQATVQHDIPVIQGAVLYITILVVLVNLLVDLAYSRLDPRVRAA